jgi:hypothetical protein
LLREIVPPKYKFVDFYSTKIGRMASRAYMGLKLLPIGKLKLFFGNYWKTKNIKHITPNSRLRTDQTLTKINE